MAQMSPAAWLDVLERRLDDRARRIQVFIDYREGRHKLRFATAKFRQAFGGLFREFSDNWCDVIVNAPVERLRVQGFRFGGSTDADKDAWDLWQANDMDAASNLVHREAITCEEAYWLVEPPRNGSDLPRITAEHPLQVIVACDPADRRRRLAALKKWLGDDGYAYATVYLPDQVAKFRSANRYRGGQRITWTRRVDDAGGRNPLGVVPVIPVVNAPTMLGGGTSDLAGAISLSDAINKTVLDMLVASEFGAFPARVVMGVEAPKGTDGKPIKDADIQMAMSKLLALKDKDAKIGEFSAADLKNYVNALEPLVNHLAAQTRTPPHYLLGTMVNVSGDALKASESGLTARTRDKMIPFGEGHEEALRLAFLSIDPSDPRASATSAETMWANPEYRSFGELVDGLTKLATIGIPHEILWEELGYSPTEIARIKEIKGLDEKLAPEDDIGDLSLSAQRLGLAAQYGVIAPEEARRLLNLTGPAPASASAPAEVPAEAE